MSCDATGSRLAVRNVSWGPSARHHLIEKVGFNLDAGDRMAIIGPNGAGKTTLLRCLYRGLLPTEGVVLLDDDDIHALPGRKVAQKIGVVLQEMPADFPFTVKDVVLMGRIPWRVGLSGWTAVDRDHADHALEHLHLQHLAKRSFSTLSGGEKQRVLIARALAQQPQIIVLDEPTNHLDIRHQLEIMELLGSLKLTVIATLHDINLAADFATKAALMHGGRMSAFGDAHTVLTEDLLSGAFGVRVRQRPELASGFTFSLAAS